MDRPGLLVRAGLIGLALVLLAGLWAYVAHSDGSPEVDRFLIAGVLVIFAVVVGGIIAIAAFREARKHSRDQHREGE